MRRFDQPMEEETFDGDTTGDFEPETPAGNGTRARLMDEARDRAQNVAGDAKEVARDVAGKAQGWVREEFDRRSSLLGEQVLAAAVDLRDAAEKLRSEGREGLVADLSERVADGVEQIAEYLSERSPDELLEDLQEFARRQPYAVAGAMFAVGFVTSRMIKTAVSGPSARTA